MIKWSQKGWAKAEVFSHSCSIAVVVVVVIVAVVPFLILVSYHAANAVF
jgi:hypothetical protein